MIRIAFVLLAFLFLSAPRLFGQEIADVKDFFEKTNAFFQEVVSGQNVEYANVDRQKLHELTNFLSALDETLEPDVRKALLINAYNLHVIDQVLSAYPITSTQKVPGFFEQEKLTVETKRYSLNSLEKQLFKEHPDPRLHFALSCAARSCPPLADMAFTPENQDDLLDTRTRMALNDANFVRLSEEGSKLALSQIFKWYSGDFGGNAESILSYLNSYRTTPIGQAASIGYYPYDWSLNDASVVGNNTARYVVSSARPKGTVEVKWFNNLYTQQIPSSATQESYFTSQLGFVYGLSDRFNIGFDIRQRYAAFHAEPSGAFDAFSGSSLRSRSAIATIGPKVRFAPNPNWPNMSIQSALWIPIADGLEGDGESPWIDWSNPTWFTQIFNDFSIGDSYAFFLELDLFWEDIGLGQPEETNRFSTPVTGIFSYFPTPRSTLYTLANFAPIWTPSADYYAQIGAGAKYQLHTNFEIELLYTYFFNQFLIEQMGRASTFNIGFRYSN